MREGGVLWKRGATQNRGSIFLLMVSPSPSAMRNFVFSDLFRLFLPFPPAASLDPLPIHSLSANRKIQSIASVLRLSDVVSLAATRLYTLAVEHKFTKGRKSLNVVAVCLYVACRQKETRNYMLIDFSELLQVKPRLTLLLGLTYSSSQVNVFELVHTYLQLVQTLNLRLPLVDPSHYISRFA